MTASLEQTELPKSITCIHEVHEAVTHDRGVFEALADNTVRLYRRTVWGRREDATAMSPGQLLRAFEGHVRDAQDHGAGEPLKPVEGLDVSADAQTLVYLIPGAKGEIHQYGVTKDAQGDYRVTDAAILDTNDPSAYVDVPAGTLFTRVTVGRQGDFVAVEPPAYTPEQQALIGMFNGAEAAARRYLHQLKAEKHRDGVKPGRPVGLGRRALTFLARVRGKV